MSEEKSIRLAKAAGEFNVAISHIVELLNSKGFSVENKPTTKLSEDMYNLLLKEYGKDKVLKEKADLVSIGMARKTEKPEEIVVAEKIIIVAAGKEEAEIVNKKTIEEVPIKKEIKKEIEKGPEPEKEQELTKHRKEEVEKPKVVGKIDLETKKKKQKEEPKEEIKPVTKKETGKKIKEEPVIEKEEEKIAAEIPPEPEIQKEEKSAEGYIPMTERKKITLEGPKILGKIELKEEKKPEKRSFHQRQDDNRKKRKRIKKGGERINVEKIKEEEKKDDRQVRADRGRVPERKPMVDPGAQERIIQEQIRNTLAKLSGSRGKQGKSKFKKSRREDDRKEQLAVVQSNNLQVAEFTSVAELASLMNVSPIDLVQKCFDLGMMVSINQRLDAEIIELLGGEFGFKISFIDVTSDTEEEETKEEDPLLLLNRPPIVTIMGHVDHGKTSLLDYIRESNVVAGEKGGITQHIGAYEVVLPNEKKIAFLDTPGHEAFTAMRARGAKLTDIAVIVIAADDQIMPQTREAISHAQAAGVPMVFAINKIDKPGSNPEKIKEQLSQMSILVEDWGGKYQSQEISAKSGLNVEVLLEKILLESELLDLKANPDKEANGTIIEALLDKGRGYISNIMVQEGTLEIGDMMVAGPYYGRVKAMFNERSQKIPTAGPSTPVLVLGLNGAPQAGEKFKTFEDEDEAKAVANKRMQILREQGIRTKKHITLEEIGRRKALGTFRELNIIIKADVDGSMEALTDSLQKLTTAEVQVNIIFRGVGQITESDVMLASASDAVIVGFQVRPSASVRKLSEKEGVEIRLYSIIYNAIEEVKAAMEGMLAPKMVEKITCTVEIRNVFKISKIGTIAGCYVLEGKITRNTKIRVLRDGIVIHTGTLASLKRFKDDAKEVTSGMECGLNINNFDDIQEGDIIEGYEEVEVKRTL